MIYEFSIVIQNGTKCSEGSRVHPLIRLRYVLEILPPFGRLDDKRREYLVILSVSEESEYINFVFTDPSLRYSLRSSKIFFDF